MKNSTGLYIISGIFLTKALEELVEFLSYKDSFSVYGSLGLFFGIPYLVLGHLFDTLDKTNENIRKQNLQDTSSK